MRNRRNYYRILQVQPDAPPEVIRASYRTLMRELKNHPDLGGSTSEAALLNEAYETLSDPARRAAYDEKMFLQFTKAVRSQTRKPNTCPICRRPLSREPQRGDVCPECRTPLKPEEPAEPGRASKRVLERTRSSEPISFYPAWPGEAEKGRMIDFSPKGMRFICSVKLAPQTVLKISSRLFEASGIVTNVSEEISNGKRFYAVGIYFMAVYFEEDRGTFFSSSA
jgi:hypothetical protein